MAPDVLLISHPHFIDGDPLLLDNMTVDGALDPAQGSTTTAEAYKSHIAFEPYTGKPFEFVARTQINFKLPQRGAFDVNGLSSAPPDDHTPHAFPFLWHETFVRVAKEKVEEVRDLHGVLDALKAVGNFFWFLAYALFAYSGWVFVVSTIFSCFYDNKSPQIAPDKDDGKDKKAKGAIDVEAPQLEAPQLQSELLASSGAGVHSEGNQRGGDESGGTGTV
jgi:hypothetical protein